VINVYDLNNILIKIIDDFTEKDIDDDSLGEVYIQIK